MKKDDVDGVIAACYIAGHYVGSPLALCAYEIDRDGGEARARTETFNKISQFSTKWHAQMTTQFCMY